MALEIGNQELEKFILVGAQVLIKPKDQKSQTKGGLYLPPSVQQKENLHSGYVLKVGPGYPIPAVTDTDEPWKEDQESIKYVPLQAKEGDLAIYLQSSSHEILFNNEKYVIVPHNAILTLIRDEGLFE
ncbi:MAG: co-chaperone GroES family protein [Bacteroidales bacterium]